MRKLIAADHPAGAAAKRPSAPRFAVRARVRIDPGTTVRVVVARYPVNGLWVYDCVREVAAGGHRVVAIGEHLLRGAD